MKKNKIGLPHGTADTLFERYEQKAATQATILSCFKSAGYRTVATPTFEYVDVFDRSNAYVEEKSYRFSDYDGRFMALRCDSSSPIARMVNSSFKNVDSVLRISYNQSVYKKQIAHGGKRHEVSQCGVELINADSTFNADLEILKLAIDSLKVAGLEKFKIELGHAGLFYAVASLLPLSHSEYEQLRQYMGAKNIAALKEFLLQYSTENEQVCNLLSKMPGLFGDLEILMSAKQLFSVVDGADAVIDRLISLHKELCALGFEDKISFDLGLVQSFGYYTGVVFSGYSSGIGEAVLSGGRYDALYGQFGEDKNAIGFAINVDAILDINATDKSLVNRPLRIALTKGRLQKDACKLMEAAGLDMSELTSNTRKLIIPIANGRYELILAKAADVITYVTHGVCDVGLVGKDTIDEQGGDFYELLDTGFGRCRFAVAAPKWFDYDQVTGTLTVASKYPKVANSFFTSKGLNIDIIKIDGSVELAPLLGLADVIVDIVETGETLRANGLDVVEEISDISARIIANVPSMKLRKEEIENLIALMEEQL